MASESDYVRDGKAEHVSDLIGELKGGTLTREAFIARAGALGLSLSGIGALLGADVATASRASRSVTRAAVLRVVDNGNGTADTLNPHKQAAPIDGMRITAMYDKLVRFDERFKPIPWLAESIEATPDAKTWTVRLRKGITWHDGSPLTATDVKFTFDEILNPAVGASTVNLFQFMKGADVKILDPLTIRYALTKPFADFMSAVGDPSGTNIISSKNFSDKTADTTPIGTGPYKFVSFTPGQESVMVRNDNYWNSPYPLADKLTISDIPDEAARINALLSGQVDLVTNVSYSQITTVKARGGQIIDIPGNIINDVVLAPDVAPYYFKDPRIRQAFQLSLDRQQIVDIVYFGLATVGNDQPIGPTYPFAPTGIPAPPRDIPRAKQLLAAAGYPNGMKASMWTSPASQGMEDFANVVQQQVKDAGFDISLKLWPASSFWSDIWLHKEFYTSAWTQRATPLLFLGDTAYSNALYNESHFRSAQADAWMTESGQTTDATQRVKLLSQAMSLVTKSAQWIIPAYGSLIHAGSTSFKWESLPPATSAPYLFNATVT